MLATSAFVGRDPDLAQVCALLAEHRIVTVTGPGGIGKTRLVAEADARLRDLYDEVHVSRLADVAAGVDATTVSALFQKASPEALALSLCDVTALVVLDSCEHVGAAAADFTSRLVGAGESASVLVTSREPLGVPGECVLVLEPLTLPAVGDLDPAGSPAVAMFLERAMAMGGRWEQTAATLDHVAEICRRLDGLPLAIELAASRARALSPAELLSLMERRLEALHTRDRQRPRRHQSVRAAIDVSVDLLDVEARTFFHHLGVIPGAFDLDLAHQVAGPTPDDRLRTVDLVTELVDRSLLVAEPAANRTRYRLLELLREHAADAMRSSGEWDAASEHLTDVMVAKANRFVAEGSQSWSAELVGQIELDHGNLTTAIQWCLAHDDSPARAVQLYLPLFASVHQNRSAQVRAVGEGIVRRWPDESVPLRAEALAVLATAAVLGSRFEEADRWARQALDDPLVTGVGVAIAERALLLAAMGRHDVATARDHASRCRAVARESGLAPFEREAMGFEASLLDQLGHTDEAVLLAEGSAQASIAAGDPITEIWARLVASTIALRGGRLAEARQAFELAQATAAAIDDSWWGGAILRLRTLLVACEASGVTLADGWEASRHLWREALEGAARRGDLSELSVTLKSAAVIAARAGRTHTAKRLMGAVPDSDELTVLPELFADERERLEASHRRPATARRSTSLALTLREALEALSEDPDPEAVAGAEAEPDAAGGTEPDPAFGEPPPAGGRRSTDTRSLRREGDVWAVTFAGQTVRMRALKGLSDLAVLLARPDVEVHCLELMGGTDVDDDTGPVLDDRARREYRERILELQAEIDDAREANDPIRADRAEVELDHLVQQLSGALGLGGRSRRTGSSAERARTAVTYRIRAAVRRIAEVHPALGRHLDASVRTGTWCAYRPETAVRWDIEAG